MKGTLSARGSSGPVAVRAATARELERDPATDRVPHAMRLGDPRSVHGAFDPVHERVDARGSGQRFATFTTRVGRDEDIESLGQCGQAGLPLQPRASTDVEEDERLPGPGSIGSVSGLVHRVSVVSRLLPCGDLRRLGRDRRRDRRTCLVSPSISS